MPMTVTLLDHRPPALASRPLDGRAIEGLRELESLAASCVATTEQPRRLAANDIAVLPVFDHRQALDDRAIHDMEKVLANGDKLPPLTVLALGGRYFLVDGRQRLEAHRLHAGRKSRAGTFTVPVVYFSGTPAEAVFVSVERNAQHGVQLTRSERMNAAWKLVLIGKKSRAEMTRATGTSRRQLTLMRRVKEALCEEAADHRGWDQALAAHQGRSGEPPTEEEQMERRRAKAYRLADRITHAIGGQHSADPELMVMAMEAFMGRKAVDFAACTRDYFSDELAAYDEAEAEEEAKREF